MIKETYFCDRCGKEVKRDEYHEHLERHFIGENHYSIDVAITRGGLCEDCCDELIVWLNLGEDDREEARNVILRKRMEQERKFKAECDEKEEYIRATENCRECKYNSIACSLFCVYSDRKKAEDDELRDWRPW